jgi:lipoprotein-releasing system ATP-binding protein
MMTSGPTTTTDNQDMANTLQAEAVTKDYPTRAGPLSVLAGVSLRLAEGQAAVITGPSGSGKSTLLNILGTLEPPTAGRVLIGGCDPFELPEPQLAEFRNRRIGFIFQEHHLLPHCSVLENVLLPTLARHGRGKKGVGSRFSERPGGCLAQKTPDPFSARGAGDAEQRARQLLERVGLADRLDYRPAELSGGERQRVAVARALINHPLIVLVDEPTGNLDAATAAKVATLILEMHREENTILCAVTHNAELAEMFERKYELADGLLKTR